MINKMTFNTKSQNIAIKQNIKLKQGRLINMMYNSNNSFNRIPQIQAILPIYSENGGNNTEICFADGETKVSNVKTKTVLKKIAESYTKDIGLIRKKYGVLINRKHQIPLPIIPDLVLVPFKFRSPIGKDEGALCYVSKTQVKNLIPCDHNNTKIIFHDDTEIKVMQGYDSVSLLLQQAGMVQREYINNLRLESLKRLS